MGCALLLLIAAGAEAQVRLADSPVPLAAIADATIQDRSIATIALHAKPPARPPEDAVQPGRARESSVEQIIGSHAALNALRPALVRAVVMAESGFNPEARSPKGALGLMQLMPDTARAFGVLDPFDPEQNVRAGTAYLRQLLDRYDNREELALAAYNAGPGAVDRHGRNVPPYSETMQYVATVTGLAGEIAPPAGGRIVKRTETIDGREVVVYTNRGSR
jgi:soluble lytic murein transglycosylase